MELTKPHPDYLDKEWKVDPKSVFDYDPAEDGIESISLSRLRRGDEKQVYEGYGRRDLLHSCAPKVKGIDPKPAISWVHRGTARWSNEARLADATSQFNYSGIKVNGIALDVEELRKAKMTIQARHQQFMASNGLLLQTNLYDAITKTENHSNVTIVKDVINHNTSSRDTPDFVELPPSFPAPRVSNVELFSPKPFIAFDKPLKLDQPLYKNFNRSPRPFGGASERTDS